MTPTLYQHPFASYCQKVLIALYELDTPFETYLVEGLEGREELARLWPPAGMPMLVDDGRVFPESTTIIEYVDRGGTLVPGLEARLWDRFADQQLSTPMQKIVADELRPEGGRDPVGVQEARQALDVAYTVLEERLGTRRFVTGDAFTIADCATFPPLFYLRAIHRPPGPNIARYHRELLGRPSIARVVDDARPYRELFPLPWPDDQDAP
jgi:glutathione S-transferase